MGIRDRHTQIGHTLIVVLALAVALGLAVGTGKPVAFAAAALVGLLLVRRIPLDRIRPAEVVRTPWYYGWGIRLTPYGWLWNVSGTGGVELSFEDGGRFRVGSDEPDRLAEAIRRGMGGG